MEKVEANMKSTMPMQIEPYLLLREKLAASKLGTAQVYHVYGKLLSRPQLCDIRRPDSVALL